MKANTGVRKIVINGSNDYLYVKGSSELMNPERIIHRLCIYLQLYGAVEHLYQCGFHLQAAVPFLFVSYGLWP